MESNTVVVTMLYPFKQKDEVRIPLILIDWS